jgi:catechol-2,3-dioxygenase
MQTSSGTGRVIDAGTRIGHVHLKVANIERALGFYRDVLGFEITQWYGDEAVFLSAGGYHHHIGLNTWMSRNADPAPAHSAGLFHLAILYPERRDLAQALRWLVDAGYPLDGASQRPSTCATPMTTASSCTATARRRSGRVLPRGNSRWLPAPWT